MDTEFKRSIRIAEEHKHIKSTFGRHIIDKKEVVLGCKHCKQLKIKAFKSPFDAGGNIYGWACKICGKPINAVLIFKK